MPAPRKVDQLPPEIRLWLEETLIDRGFSGYLEVTAELNRRLEAAGVRLTIQKSAVADFGSGYARFVELQKRTTAWAERFLAEEGVQDEAKGQRILAQMLQTLAFEFMEKKLDVEAAGEGAEALVPNDMQRLAKTIKDLMHSTAFREKLLADEHERIRKEERAAAAEAASKALAGAAPGASPDDMLRLVRQAMGLR